MEKYRDQIPPPSDFDYAPAKAVNPCGMACCHDAVWHGVLSSCSSQSCVWCGMACCHDAVWHGMLSWCSSQSCVWCGMACCHDAVWHGVLSSCSSQSCVCHWWAIFSHQLPPKHSVLLCRTVDSQAGNAERNPEELPHCSRTQTTCSWSLTSSASTLLDGRRMTLPLGWLLLCSWVITKNPAFIACSELRMEVLFLFGLFLQALAQSKLVLFLVILQQMGTNFLAICLKSLVHMSSCTIWCA